MLMELRSKYGNFVCNVFNIALVFATFLDLQMKGVPLHEPVIFVNFRLLKSSNVRLDLL